MAIPTGQIPIEHLVRYLKRATLEHLVICQSKTIASIEYVGHAPGEEVPLIPMNNESARDDILDTTIKVLRQELQPKG